MCALQIVFMIMIMIMIMPILIVRFILPWVICPFTPCVTPCITILRSSSSTYRSSSALRAAISSGLRNPSVKMPCNAHNSRRRASRSREYEAGISSLL